MTAHREFLRSSARLELPFCLLVLIANARLGPAFAQEHPVRFVQVPRDVIESRLRRVAQENADRETSLKQIFAEAGCDDDHLREQAVKHQKLPNVICTLPGTSDSVMIVAAHFDHVEKGDGVVDNWSGAALLPSLFQSLRAEPRKHSMVFIGFTAEEQGLIGSDFYVKQLTPDQTAKISAMIDLDSLGLGPTNIWLNHSDEKLANTLNGVAASLKLPLAVVNAEQIGDDDSTSFRKRHVPTIMLHSVTQPTVAILHSDRDNLSAISMDDYYDSYHLLAAYLAYLDAKLN